MPSDKPDLAMLLMKPKKGPDMSPSKDEHAADLGKDGMDGEAAETSAAKDALMAVKAGDVGMFKAALKDLMEICYPSLTDDQEEHETPPDSEDTAEE